MDGKRVICPTPLGNLGDLTERALADEFGIARNAAYDLALKA